MIWYEEPLSMQGLPDEYVISVMGIYHKPPSTHDIIEILIHLQSHNDSRQIVLYSHNPTMMKLEDPTAEDILCKYQAKINKISNTLSNYDYVSLLQKWPSLRLSV